MKSWTQLAIQVRTYMFEESDVRKSFCSDHLVVAENNFSQQI